MQFLAHLKIYSSLTVTVTEWTIVKGALYAKIQPILCVKENSWKGTVCVNAGRLIKKIQGIWGV